MPTVSRVAMEGDLERLASIVARRLSSSHQRIAIAESCTGGLLCSSLTDISGASTWFERGWIVYSNEAKTESLGVSPQLIEAHGAVSVEVAEAMVLGVIETVDVDWAVAISGIAGPMNDEGMKSVGTVCIAVANRIRSVTRQREFSGDRSSNKRFFTCMALEMILEAWEDTEEE